MWLVEGKHLADLGAPLKLGLDQIDLFILHQPMPRRFDLTIEAYRAPSSACSRTAASAPSASATSCPTTWRASPRPPARTQHGRRSPRQRRGQQPRGTLRQPAAPVGVGPGINDNGPGSAVNLEIAEQMTKVNPRKDVRFMWFGAEESGLLGSDAYVAGLSDEERAQIAAMLNFDMVGSPNFVRFVYDGDLSDSVPPPSGAPEGSAQIEALLLDYFEEQGLPTLPTPFDGRSDYGPFIEVGIPAGGLFTGAEGIKTAEQAAIFGGTVGAQYDACYHLSCDTMDNLSLTALDQMSDAAAHATISLAQSTEAIQRCAWQGQLQRQADRTAVADDVHDRQLTSAARRHRS